MTNRSGRGSLQGNRKIACTVKTSVAIRSRQVGRNVAHMETVLSLA